MKLTQNYDFYDFPMPVYARISIYVPILKKWVILVTQIPILPDKTRLLDPDSLIITSTKITIILLVIF